MLYTVLLQFSPRAPGKIHRLYFGAINIGGKIYEQDRILSPEGVSPPWWRTPRHYLKREEFIRIVSAYNPRIILIGTGWMGMMEVDRRIRHYARRKGMEIFVDRTPRIVELYNSLRSWQEDGLLAILHLTC